MTTSEPAPSPAAATVEPPAADPPFLASRPAWIDWIVVVAAALLAHAGILGGGFIYDDTLVCFADVAKHASGVWAIFNPVDYFVVGAGEASWRPLATFTHWLDWRIAGDHPFWPRVVNLGLHAAAAGLLWKLARRWGYTRLAALTAGLVLAVHPLTSESVAIISFREEMLVAVGFAVAGLLAAVPNPKPGHLIGAGVATFLACGAKELGLMIPPLLAAAAWALPALPGEPADEPRARRVLRWAGPAAAGALCFAVLRFAVFVPPDDFDMGYTGHPGGGGLATGLTMLQIMARYAGLFLLPVGQSVDHTPVVVESLADWRAWTALGATVAMLALGAQAWRRAPRAAIGWTWVVLCLLPVLDLIPLANIMAERYTYVALGGAGLGLGWLAQRWYERRALAGRPAAVIAAVLVAFAAASAVRHWVRAPIWKHDAALWADVGRTNPASFRAIAMYGYILAKVPMERGELQAALDRVTDAERTLGRPLVRGEAYAEVRDRLAGVLRDADFANPDHIFEVEMARKELEVALREESVKTAPRWSPEEAANWLNLGIACYETGVAATDRRRPYRNAIERYTTLMKDRQRDGLDVEPLRQQISHAVDALQRLPDPKPWLERGATWMRKSVETPRMPLFMRATAYENLSACVGLAGDADLSAEYAKKSLQLQPGRVYAHYNLGVYYGQLTRRTGDAVKGERFLKQAIEHYRACFHDPRTTRLAFLNYYSLAMATPEYAEPRSPASKAIVDEWAALADQVIPGDLEFRKQLATRCLITKLNRRAWDQYHRVLAQEPGWAEGYVNLASLAEEGLEEGVDRRGDVRLALQKLQAGYQAAGKAAMEAAGAAPTLQRLEARVALEELLAQAKERPGDYAVQARLAHTYFAVGLWREARAALERAEALDRAQFARDDHTELQRALADRARREAEAQRLEQDGTVADLVAAAKQLADRANFDQAQTWLKRAQEKDVEAYDRLGARALHTRVQQVIDIASAPERSAEELAQRATQAALDGAWPYAVYLWRACRRRDTELFRRVAGPGRLAEAESKLPR